MDKQAMLDKVMEIKGNTVKDDVVRSVINAGFDAVPDGYVFAKRSGCLVKADKSRNLISIVKEDTGEEVKTVEWTQDLRDNALMNYAERMSRQDPYTMGDLGAILSR